MIELGHAEPPDPQAPGMFRLAPDGRLRGVLDGAGFLEVSIEPVALERRYTSLDQYLRETVDMSPMFSATFDELHAEQQAAVLERVKAGAEPFTAADGSVVLPGSSLVASAAA
jgi:hypothetical protein